MSLYQILQARDWYSKHFRKSTMLCAYPPHLYTASAQYLAFSVESISRKLLIMRRPLPIDLGTILANKYRKGLYNHLLHSDRFPQMFRMFKILKMRERERGLECLIPNVLRRQLRAPQSINEGFTNFIWRRVVIFLP